MEASFIDTIRTKNNMSFFPLSTIDPDQQRASFTSKNINNYI